MGRYSVPRYLPAPGPRLYRAGEAAAVLGWDRRKLQRRAAEGWFTAIRTPGGTPRYLADEIDACRKASMRAQP